MEEKKREEEEEEEDKGQTNAIVEMDYSNKNLC